MPGLAAIHQKVVEFGQWDRSPRPPAQVNLPSKGLWAAASENSRTASESIKGFGSGAICCRRSELQQTNRATTRASGFLLDRKSRY